MRATSRLSSPAPLALPNRTSSIRSGSSAGRAVDERAHDVRGEVVGAHARQRAAVAAERRAHRVVDVGGAHRASSSRSAASSSSVGGSVVAQLVGDAQRPSRSPRAPASTVDARVQLRSASARRPASGSSTPRSVITAVGARAAWSCGSRAARRTCAASAARSRRPRAQPAAISGAPPAPGRRVRGCVVVADHGRVEVGVAVDLRGAEERDLDAPGPDPVVEHLGHRDDEVGRLGQLAVADRQRDRGTAWRRSCPTRRRARGRGCGPCARGSRPCSGARRR